MSGNEVGALIVSSILALVFWLRWYWSALTVHRLASRAWERLPVYAALPASTLVLFVVLKRYAAEDVRFDTKYLLFYLVLGAAWVGVGTVLLPLLGISPRDDVCERRNGAAGLAAGGAVIGLTLAFAGGNIGDGPGWWVVLFAAALATGTLVGLWIILEGVSGVLLAAAAIIADRLFKPSPQQPQPPVFMAGVLPAGLYLAAAGLVLILLGWWT
jgi:hypothetical protein